jgi:glycopeptide antibiotics resistance protein
MAIVLSIEFVANYDPQVTGGIIYVYERINLTEMKLPLLLKKIEQMLLFLFIVTVFYFSWLPNPDFRTESYLPLWLNEWSNYYYNVRTAVPFVAIGFLLEMVTYKNISIENSKSRVGLFIQNISIATTIVCIAEGGQFLIHSRSPDFMDVFFGIVGSTIGSLGYHTIQLFMNFKSIQNEK